MEQIIYADVLFIVNFSMDFLALYITARLLHRDGHFFALVFSAGIGALYGVLALFMSGHPIVNGAINTAVALLMSFIAYGFPSLILLIRNTLIFYGISFLMGGVMTGIYNLANKGLAGRGIVINGDMNTLQSGISPLVFIVLALAAVLFSYLCAAVTKKTKEDKIAEVSVRLGDRTLKIKGFCDSGNLLCEPIGSLPCVICSYEALKELIPIGLRPLFRDKNVSLLEFADPEFAKKVRMIPMKSVGSSGILCGIIPDEIRINGEAKRLCVALDPQGERYSDAESIIPMSVM